jgi:hypothetical protein
VDKCFPCRIKPRDNQKNEKKWSVGGEDLEDEVPQKSRRKKMEAGDYVINLVEAGIQPH